MLTIKKSPTYFEVYLRPSSYSQKAYGLCLPGRKYMPTKTFRHKDSIGRVWVGPEDDRYLSATDGRLAELVVQAPENVWGGPANSTWARAKVAECTPAILRVVYSLLGPHLQNDPDASWAAVCFWWLPSCLVLAVLVSWHPKPMCMACLTVSSYLFQPISAVKSEIMGVTSSSNITIGVIQCFRPISMRSRHRGPLICRPSDKSQMAYQTDPYVRDNCACFKMRALNL